MISALYKKENNIPQTSDTFFFFFKNCNPDSILL